MENYIPAIVRIELNVRPRVPREAARSLLQDRDATAGAFRRTWGEMSLHDLLHARSQNGTQHSSSQFSSTSRCDQKISSVRKEMRHRIGKKRLEVLITRYSHLTPQGGAAANVSMLW